MCKNVSFWSNFESWFAVSFVSQLGSTSLFPFPAGGMRDWEQSPWLQQSASLPPPAPDPSFTSLHLPAYLCIPAAAEVEDCDMTMGH